LIVVDSSAALDYLLGAAEAGWVGEQLDRAEWRAHAPHLIDIEVVGVVRRFVLARELEAETGAEYVQRLTELPIHRYRHLELLERVWELRTTLTASDACFVALAEALDAPLVTTDRRLDRAHGLRIPILTP
jgi:predicted nucleic acid-binding protein